MHDLVWGSERTRRSQPPNVSPTVLRWRPNGSEVGPAQGEIKPRTLSKNSPMSKKYSGTEVLLLGVVERILSVPVWHWYRSPSLRLPD